MKGKEGTGDPGEQDAKSERYSSGSGLCPSGEKGFFADLSVLNILLQLLLYFNVLAVRGKTSNSVLVVK